MATSGQIETLCRPFYEERPTPAPWKATAQEKAAEQKAYQRAARVEHRASVEALQQSRAAAPPAIRTGMHEADAGDDWDTEDESWWAEAEPESEDATQQLHTTKVEEYLIAMHPAADVAVIKDIAACAVSTTASAFAAIAWGREKLAEMLAPPPTVPVAPVAPADPLPEWELLEGPATPRSVASDTSWADCGAPALQRTYAAVAAEHETTQQRAGAPAWSIPPLAHARRPRTTVLRECPTIPEAEAMKEERVCSGEQRRFTLGREKRASVPRARRLERKACVAAC